MFGSFFCMDEEEYWKPVVGFDGKFEVSNFGRIKAVFVDSHFNKKNYPKILKPCKDARGYFNFSVTVNGKPKTLYIHREEAKAFLENPKNLKIVRHLNDNKEDNRLINLCWGTHKDNRADSIKNGTSFHEEGKRAAKAKLTESQVLYVMKSKKNNSELGRQLGVTESTISKIRTGREWNRITGLPRLGNKCYKSHRK